MSYLNKLLDRDLLKLKDSVLEFIFRRFGSTDAHWQDGNCYYFAVILKERFPKGKIIYDPISNHFLFKYRGHIYDSKGLDKEEREILYDWDRYENFDKSAYDRVVKYCIK